MHTRHTLWLCVVAAHLVAACGGEVPVQEPDPMNVDRSRDNATVDAGGAVDMPVVPGAGAPMAPEPDCRPIAAESLPAREAIMQPGPSGGGSTVKMLTVNDLFSDFTRFCSPCHTDNSDGKFQVRAADAFTANVDMVSLERMRHTDRRRVMPQGGSVVLLSERTPADPIRAFDANLAAWLAAGKPPTFPDPSAPAALPPVASTTDPYKLTPELGKSLSNMGSCVPARRIMFSEAAHKRSDELDAMFEKASEFPDKLSQTDLFTLDSQVLAQHGVISYAPAYTLWADDAKKMRYIRVPRGKSVQFSVATQSFQIPDNTRFYKTFLKEVKDANGKVGYKKIETRIILVRKATPAQAGQADTVNALYGTYIWNEDESEAELVKRRLNNGEGFTDVIIDYIPDEIAAKARVDELNSKPRKPNQTGIDLDLFGKGLKRHYAVPGSERCVQCHMGGPDGSFILAFSPLQVVRRPLGEGGVIEAAGPDELNQLQRLIDYGVITGVASPTKILPLEKSQGARSPRNKYELIAQGYMLGNCAHCHNPKGYATIQSQGVLTDLLDFYPSATGGGIFEFPLDRFSPRISRGPVTARTPIPYITPSLYDLGYDKEAGGETGNNVGSSSKPYLAADYATWDPSAKPLPAPALAPWRSLIYRNVDAPYVYSAKNAIFPHMPMNTPGFDCRAPRIMAEWMVSIPARPIKQSVAWFEDTLPQPFEEVRPGSPDYATAQLQGELRRVAYQAGERYKYCPDTTDIVDVKIATAALRGEKPSPDTDLNGFPKRPHFIETDLTEKPGAWAPRQPKWEDYLVRGDVSWVDGDASANSTEKDAKKLEQTKMLPLLMQARLTPELRKMATERVPFGFWAKKSSCDLSSQPRLSSFADDPAWTWMKKERSGHDPNDPVYMQAPGEAIFKQICVNCHGTNADSRGRQADTVLMLSGGSTRVANFRAGLFGPERSPGTGRGAVFGRLADGNSTVEDWAARYLSWMALGGTTKPIPSEVLSVVGQEPVLGRVPPRGVPASPNMLNAAFAACARYLPVDPGKPLDQLAQGSENSFALQDGRPFVTPNGVVLDNGDADLWRRVCSYDNPLPIRVVGPAQPWADFAATAGAKLAFGTVANPPYYVGLYRRLRTDGRPVYPADAQVGNHEGVIERGIQPSNLAPVCVRRPSDPSELAIATRVVDEEKFVFCPDSLFETGPDGTELHRLTLEDAWSWARRGAINAGFAVFSYLDAYTKGEISAQPAYDQCEQLTMTRP